MWITFDSGMSNFSHSLDSLTQSKKKDQAMLFSPLTQGFNVCTRNFNIIY